MKKPLIRFELYKRINADMTSKNDVQCASKCSKFNNLNVINFHSWSLDAH